MIAIEMRMMIVTIGDMVRVPSPFAGLLKGIWNLVLEEVAFYS
jgi:hypothetical protein